uniref:Uncharacterized protein n=1 Tax=Erpetoichthys calabaricus TaxID=27687 RepID=A0A8C4S8G4_ERPCA
MTSRFGKTYSRKGGNSNSKFDEVLSNKRATLSTKWGETTFKAQLGSKRPHFKPEIAEIPKRPKYQEDKTSEDPFGFDSDEDSKPVSSRNTLTFLYVQIMWLAGHLFSHFVSHCLAAN